jgi:hypothetical protein
MDVDGITMDGVREYAEEFPVELVTEKNGRIAVRAWNEGRFNCTSIDLLDLLKWVRENKPELLTDSQPHP